MRRLSVLLVAAFVAVILVGGCEHFAPERDQVKQISIGLEVTDGLPAVDGYEWIGNSFIVDGRTVWGAESFSGTTFQLTTYSGSPYSGILIRNGMPMYIGFKLNGANLVYYWTSEDYGVFGSFSVLVDGNTPVIEQPASNLDHLVWHNIEVINTSGHARVGVVGTGTCFAATPAEVTPDGSTLRTVLWTVVTDRDNWVSGNNKIAVVDLDTLEPVTDLVTVKVNGVELNSKVYYQHDRNDRWPGMTYYRYHIGIDGVVNDLIGSCWSEDCWTHDNTVQFTNLDIDPSEPIALIGELTGSIPHPMTYIGDGVWELEDITTSLEPHTFWVVDAAGNQYFRSVSWNGALLHHLVLLNGPTQSLEFTPRSDGGADQGDDNLIVNVDVGDKR